MIVVLKPGTPQEIVENLVSHLQSWQLETQTIVGRENTVIGLVGDTSSLADERVSEPESIHRPGSTGAAPGAAQVGFLGLATLP